MSAQRRDFGYGRSTAGWRILAGTGTGASAALALLVLATVFVAMVIPRANLSQRTHALQQALSQLPTAARTVTASIDYESYAQVSGGDNPQDELTGTKNLLARELTAAHVPIATRAAWTNLAMPQLPTAGAARRAYYGSAPPAFQLFFRDVLRANARLEAGTWPAKATRQGGLTMFEAAVTPATAARFELHIGSRLGLGPGMSMVVTAILRPVAPGAAFWTEFSGVLTPYFTATRDNGFWTGGALIGAGEVAALLHQDSAPNSQLNWVYPLNLSGVSADQAAALVQHITNAASQSAAVMLAPGGQFVALGMDSGITPTVTAFVTAGQAADSILSLLFVSITVLGIVVLLLCTQLAADRREDEFAIMRARGATRAQLALVVLRSGLLVALPAAVVAVLLAIVLIPGGQNALSWWLASLTTVMALAGQVLLAARRDPSMRRRRGGGVRTARRVAVARRLVVEITLTALAVAGLIVLRRQGLSASGSINALASASPVLVAVPAAIIMVRLCPLVLARLQRVARRSRGFVAYMGLARGAQRSSGTLLPVFALVLALAVITFGGTFRSAVNRGEQAAAWQLAGADAMVGAANSTLSVTPAAQRALSAVSGVERVASVLGLPGAVGPYGAGGAPFNAAIVNPGQYAALLARTPAAPFPARALSRSSAPPGDVPVLASPDAAAALRAAGDVATVNGTQLHVSVRGILRATPAAPAGAPFLVVPQWAVPGGLPPTMILLSGARIDRAALAAVAARMAPGVPVTFRSAVLSGLMNAPLPRATYVAFLQGSAAAVIFSLIVVLIATLLGARARELTDARLATMGVSPRQVRRVGIVEAVPFILAAAIGGALAAAVLVPLIGPALNLSAFTGTPDSVHMQPDVLTLALGSAALVLLALITMAIQAAAAARRGVGRALRAGD